MADADKQKEMDAKKAEVQDVFFFILLLIATMMINAIKIMIINAIKIMITKIMIINTIKIMITNAIMVRILVVTITIVRCEQGWRLRLQGRRTRRVS